MARTALAERHPHGLWPLSARPRLPYAFDTVEIIDAAADPYPKSDSDMERFWQTERRHLLDPIHPHLFKLEPGNARSFTEFVSELGIAEIIHWLIDRFDVEPEPWKRVIWAYEVMGFRKLWSQDLHAAWTDAETAQTFAMDLAFLRDGFRHCVEAPSVEAAAELAVDMAEAHNMLRIGLLPHPTGRFLYERPVSIFSRAWLELLDVLITRKQMVKVCAYCSDPFEPSRTSQRYCPGTRCQQKAHDRRYSQKASRREYNRMHQAHRRGAISDDEWESYKQQRREAKASREEKTNGIDP